MAQSGVPVENYTHAGEGGCTASHLSRAHLAKDQNRLLANDNETYAYDVLDRRVAKTVRGAVTSLVYYTSMDDPLAFHSAECLPHCIWLTL